MEPRQLPQLHLTSVSPPSPPSLPSWDTFQVLEFAKPFMAVGPLPTFPLSCMNAPSPHVLICTWLSLLILQLSSAHKLEVESSPVFRVLGPRANSVCRVIRSKWWKHASRGQASVSANQITILMGVLIRVFQRNRTSSIDRWVDRSVGR